MEPIENQKKAHELRVNVTAADELYYKEPAHLTQRQKEEMLQEVEEIKKRIALTELAEEANRKKHEGSTFKEERLWY